MRLFIAIDFDTHKNYLQRLQKEFEGLGRYTLPKVFHITLKFLGEVADKDLSEIRSSLEKVKFEPFSLTLSELGVFPSPNYIRVLWVGVKPTEEVTALQKQIENALGFRADNRFHPHITLARVKFIRDKTRFGELLKSEVEAGSTTVESFLLVKSELTPQGPIYEDIASFPSLS